MREPSQPSNLLPRVPTGVSGLDVIVKGGLLQGGLYMILGTPGTGKTILCNQIAFHHVASGHRAVYVTLLAETHARLFAHLRSLSFFDADPISDSLYYVSGYPVLEQEGLSGLLDLLRQTVRAQRATLLVLDGMISIEPEAERGMAYKRFMQELQVTMEVNNCTTLLISPTGNQVEALPEHTMADGVIALSNRLVGARGVREIEVRKFRGSAFLEGRHSLEIDSSGIIVHPRIEAVFSSPPEVTTEARVRMRFGVLRLDEMLRGGVLSGSTTMLLGAPGSGKTSLGLHFLTEGAREGQRGLHFGFYETPPRLISKAGRLGIGFGAFVEQGAIQTIWQPALENNLDALAEKLLSAVHQRGVQRLVIDGLNAFHEVAYPERMGRYFVALTNELRARNVTTIFSREWGSLIAPSVELPEDTIGEIGENIILLRYVELRSQLYRLISIIKVRESDYDASIREFRITNNGIEVASTFESAEAILTGIARPSTMQAERRPERGTRRPRGKIRGAS